LLARSFSSPLRSLTFPLPHPPSIIFNGYHELTSEANKTYIRGLNKLCKKIIEYDAKSLYLWAIAQEMPTGKHEHITNYDINN
jgi:hypothetical protein